MLKQQAVFYSIAKRKHMPQYHASQAKDDKIKYFNECLREKVLCFPLLNRVVQSTLILKNTVLSEGVCMAIKAVLKLVPNLVEAVVLDCNALNGNSLQLLIEGLQH